MGNVCLQGAHGRIRVRRGDPNGKGPITTQVVSISTVWEKEKMMDSDFLYNDSAFDDEDFLGNDEEDQMVVDLEVPAASKIGFTRSADPTMSSRRDFHTLSSSFQLPSFEGGWPKSDRKRSKSKSGHHRQGSGSITPNLTDGSEPSVILQMMDVDSALMFDGRVIAPPPRREHASLRYAAQDIALKAADSGEDIDLAVFKPTASAYSNVKKNGKNSPFAPKPRQSSLTVLALDMPKIIAGVLKHFSYAHTQRLSRVNHKWRDAAASILNRQHVVVTLCWDWGGREWSIAAFPVEEYVLDDIASDSSAKKSSNNRRIMGSSHMSQYQRRAEASDNEDEDDGFAERRPIFDGPIATLASPTPVTVYRPVTFNMEDNSPGPLPIRITEVTQIRVTPLSTGPARSFRANWGTAPEKPSSSDMDSTPPHRRRYERTDSAFCASDDDDDSTTRGLAASATSTISLADEGLLGQTCVKGRLQSRRDRQVFSDCIFGTDFGLMLTPSGSGIERLYIVGNVGPAPVIRKAPTPTPVKTPPTSSLTMKSPMDTSNLWTASTSDGMDMFEDISVSTVWNGHSECPTIHVFAPEDEGALSDSTSIRLGSEPEFKGEPSKQIVARTRWERLVWAQKSIGGSLEQIAEIKDTVAVRFYLACSDSDQLWAFRQVVETLIDTLDPERGHVELSECMSKLDRISYRVDILSQLGIHGSQKAERLRSYYKEGCRLWRGIRGGDLSLRVSGYGGDVGREEHVYRHLANVVVPSFSGDA